MQRRPYILVIFLLLVGLGAWQVFFIKKKTADLPDPDLSSVEPQVAKKISALLQQVGENPASAVLWGRLAMNFDIHDFKQEAQPCYQKAAGLDPDDFRWPYYCATMLAEQGSPAAFTWFERCRELKPDYLPGHILYGQALLNYGKIEGAEAVFRQALQVDPASSHAWLGLAQIALAQGEDSVARDHLLQAVQHNPRHAEAHALLSGIYQRLGQAETAAQHRQIAGHLPAITPVPDPLYSELAAEGVSVFWYEKRGLAFLRKGAYREAVSELRMAVQLKPSAERHNNLAFALQGGENYTEAEAHYRAALKLRPDFRDAQINLATVLFRNGRVLEAIELLEQAVAQHPAFADAYFNLGTYYWRSNRPADAIRVLRQGLDKAPYDPRTALRLAWLLAVAPEAALRNGPEAVALARTACEQTGFRMPEALDVLAAAHAESGDFKQAVVIAEKARELAAASDRTELSEQIAARIQVYHMKQPFREKRS